MKFQVLKRDCVWCKGRILLLQILVAQRIHVKEDHKVLLLSQQFLTTARREPALKEAEVEPVFI